MVRLNQSPKRQRGALPRIRSHSAPVIVDRSLKVPARRDGSDLSAGAARIDARVAWVCESSSIPVCANFLRNDLESSASMEPQFNQSPKRQRQALRSRAPAPHSERPKASP